MKLKFFSINALEPEADEAALERYEESLKYLRDLKNSENTARLEGRQEEKLDIARNLLDILDDATIALKTGLTADTVRQLRAGT